MTKKQIQEIIINEYIEAMDTAYFFETTMVRFESDQKKIESFKHSATMYHREAETIERLYKKLFGNDVNLFEKYLDTI